MKRYFRALQQEADFNRWRQGFIIPEDRFIPAQFGAELAESRALFLQGRSGIGKTSYFQFLMFRYALGDVGAPRSVVPVFVPLRIYQHAKPEEMVLSQLEKYGLLTDKSLNEVLLKHGGFLIFFDGLNEIDDPKKRLAISRFIDKSRLVNFYVVSSQGPDVDFDSKEVRLSTLSPGKIEEFIETRLDAASAQAITKQFDETMKEIYAIPKNLEIGLEVWKSEQSMPKSLKALYLGVMEPINKIWEEEGEARFISILRSHAFQMIRGGEHRFDAAKTLPDEIRQTLVEAKILVQREQQYLFDHDLVRAALAALHLRSEWRDVLADTDLRLNQNWLAMLELMLEDLDDSEFRGVAYLILAKSLPLARQLFKYAHRNFPDKCRNWRSEFEAELGAATLREEETLLPSRQDSWKEEF